MYRKLLLIIVAAILTATTCFAADVVVSGTSYGINWVVTDDGVLTLTKADGSDGKMKNYGATENYAPWTDYNSKVTKLVVNEGITEIGEYAFYQMTNLKNATLPDRLTNIKKMAFGYCTGLKDPFIIPSTVTTLEAHAIYDCTGLTTIDIPASVKSIGNNCFCACTNLKNITLHEGLETISGWAFGGWDGNYANTFSELEIPSTVKTIGDYAFRNRINLKKITIPANVSSIGNNPFYYSKLVEIEIDPANTNFVVEDGVLYDKNKTLLISYPMSKTDEVFTVPSTVKTIGQHAFGNNPYLKEVILPSELNDIQPYAFYKATALTTLKIPEKVTSLGDGFISGCANLTNLSVDENNKNFVIIDGVIFTEDRETLLLYPNSLQNKTYEIPSSVKSVRAYAFSLNTVLEEVTFPKNSQVKNFGNDAFLSSKALKKIIFPNIANQTSTLGSEIFYGCSGLQEVKLPENITSLPYRAFSGCSKLGNIDLPYKITTIKDDAFVSDSAMTEIILPPNLTSLGGNCFNGCSFITEIVIPNGVQSIGENTFKNCWRLKRIEISSGTTYFSNKAIVYDYPTPNNPKPKIRLIELCIKSATPPTIKYDSFVGLNFDNKSTKLIVPCGSSDAYKNHKTEEGLNVYNVKFTLDDMTMANFNKLTVELSESSDPESGTVAITREAACGVNPTIEATANKGYSFVGWNIGSEEEVNANPYQIQNFNSDRRFIAFFEQIPYYIYYKNAEGKLVSIDLSTLKVPFLNGAVSVVKSDYYYGDNVQLTYEPALGYELKTISIRTEETDETIEVSEDGTFTMPAENVILSAEFGKIDYTITFANSGNFEHGSITTTPSGTANYGDKVTIVATPDNKYKLASATVSYGDGKTATISDVAGETNQKTFFMPNDNVTISAVFEEIDYRVPVNGTFEVGDFKYTVTSLEPNKVSVAAKADVTDKTLEILPEVTYLDITYTIESISSLGFIEASNTVVIDRQTPMALGENAMAENVLLKVPCGYKVAYQDAGYPNTTIESITPYPYSVSVSVVGSNGTAQVNRQPDCDDHSAEIEAIPAEGYEFEEWDDNKTIIKRTINNVTENKQFKASFKAIIYSIGKTEASNGTFSVSPTEATINQSVEITVTPNTGYQLDKITVTKQTGGTVTVNTSVTPFTFKMPASDVTVDVTFKAIPYTITFINDGHGTVSSPVGTTATIGTNVELTAAPTTGYKLKSLTAKDGDSQNITISESAFTMPASNVTVNATFEKENYTITTNVVGNVVDGVTIGKVSVQNSAHYKDVVSISITDVYQNYSYSIEGVTLIQNQNKFEMPAKNVTITVTFKKTSDFFIGETFTIDDFKYTITSMDDLKTVSVAASKVLSGDITIPTSAPYQGKTFEVTAITANGFKNCTALSSVTIKSDVAPALNENAFATNVAKLQVPCSASNAYKTAGYETYFNKIEELYEGHQLFVKVRSGDEEKGSVAITREPSCGTNPQAKATPNTGYMFTGWSNSESGENLTVTLDQLVSADVTVTASFEVIDYYITNKNEGDEIRGVVTVQKTAHYNDEIAITATPKPGYEVGSIKVTKKNSEEEVTVEGGKFNMPAFDVEVSVEFTAIDYDIVKADTENGEIVVEKEIGHVSERIKVSTKPAVGYQQKSLVVKDADEVVYEITNGAFTMPAKSVTVSAEFEKRNYTINVESTKGSVYVNPEAKIAQFEDVVTLSLEADENCVFESLVVRTGTGKEVEYTEVTNGIKYTFSMPAEVVYVTAVFDDVKYNISVDESIENGSVEPSATKAKEGETITLTVTPANKYKLATISVTGVESGVDYDVDEDNTFTMPDEDVRISATFEKNSNPTSIGEQDAANDIKAYGVSRAIILNVSIATDIVIVDITGRTVWTEAQAEGRYTIPANRGIYFVRYKGGIKEVIVR
ncbi:MAG: leucine-rich repeat domain-containing protein [Bacteroidales bacterium]|nr:leucine-rich repeat domain-containing protein [Bacteroidales bacterium]